MLDEQVSCGEAESALGIFCCYCVSWQQTSHSVTCNMSAGGSCSPHHRGTPRRRHSDTTAIPTANHSLHNRKHQQHRDRTRRTHPNPPGSQMRGADRLKLRSHPHPTHQTPGRRWCPSRPLTAPSLPVRPTRFVTYWRTTDASNVCNLLLQ